jgi:hypothetical protein
MLSRRPNNGRRKPAFAMPLRPARGHRSFARRCGERLAVVAASGLLLAGCTSVSRSTVDTLQLVWQGTPKLSPTIEQVQAKPYFQLRAITAHGDAILILGNVVGARQYWYGTSGVALVLEHGRVVQTIGLAQNLDGSRIDRANDPFVHGLQTLGAATSYDRIDDWSPGYRYGIPVHATLKPAGETSIDILGTAHRVLLVTEEVSAKVAGLRVSNRYWVDPSDGFVWMSEQEVMPGMTIKLVQLRPYRGSKS